MKLAERYAKQKAPGVPRIPRLKSPHLHTDPFYSGANQSYILKSVQELRAGKGQAHELIEDDGD
ncbi:MAG: hypothetical protein IJ702_03985 [Fretibacterium sp.]|nr:hypothetical protein [Fretibacterium sp.]